MTKSKFLAVGLVLAMANLNIYLPVLNTTPCSCRSKQNACQIEHACPHCSSKKETAKHKGMPCHSETKPSAEMACRSQAPRAENSGVKICDPTCGAGTSLAFTLTTSKPVILSEHLQLKQYLESSSLSIYPIITPEQVYLAPLDKPPILTAIQS